MQIRLAYTISGLILFLVVLYYPILGTYAHTDAYEFFWNAKRNPDFHHVFIQGGRPIFGFILTKLFQWTISIDDLKYIRIISFFGNTVLIIMFYYYLKSLVRKMSAVLALTLFFASSPFICIAMSWSALFQAGWAMLAAGISAYLCVTALSDQVWNSQKILKLISAVLIALISLMLYQPSFTFFVFVIFVVFDQNRDIRLLVLCVGIYLLVFGLYFILFKAMLWYTELPPLGRSHVSLDVFAKIKWFVETAFVNSLKFNLIIVRNSYANFVRVPVALLFLYCICLYFYTNGANRKTVTYALAIVVAYLLAYLPSLAAVENHASNRSLGTLVVLNGYFLYKAIDHLFISKKIALILTIAITSVFVCAGFYNLRFGVTNIQTAEYAILKNAVRKILEEDTERKVNQINIIRPSRQFLEEQHIVQRESGGEFGLLSNSVDWATLPMFLAIIDEVAGETGHDPTRIGLNVCNVHEYACINETAVVDVGKEFLAYPGEF
ncbi:MAG: hypothetical protein KDC99_02620 [Cyclobacteriaceae bacterium]|nr:hypothetical protein [Cyclobacteriaceae bacterium]